MVGIVIVRCGPGGGRDDHDHDHDRDRGDVSGSV